MPVLRRSSFFFFNDTATTEIYTLSLHDALPISSRLGQPDSGRHLEQEPAESQLEVDRASIEALEAERLAQDAGRLAEERRSEEHTSELQSRLHLVCRLLLEKKKKDESNAHVHD